jgi:hypothetical protein
MPTATQIISGALGLLGIRAPGDEIDPDIAEVVFDRLNTLLDAWRTGEFYAYTTQTITGTLPANTQSVTIGPAMTLAITPRPVKLEASSFFTEDGFDHPLIPVTEAEFNHIVLKNTAAGGQKWMFYRPGAGTTGTVSFWPRSSSNVALSIVCQLQVSEFTDYTTDVVLPAGYRRALQFTLAEECAADFEREIPPTVARNARAARRDIKTNNFVVPQLEVCSRGQAGIEFGTFPGV